MNKQELIQYKKMYMKAYIKNDTEAMIYYGELIDEVLRLENKVPKNKVKKEE